MSRQTSKQLKELQHFWDKKLEDTGFEDIEKTVRGERMLKQYAQSVFKRSNSVHRMEQRLEYYLLISHLCHEMMFGNFVDRFIMEHYAEGIKQKEILKRLKDAGIKRSRWKTLTTIKKYLAIWGLRDTK